MSKAVLFSIKPKYCELIASGKKTVEVRKTRPKIDVPFKCYIYCTINGTTAKERDKNIFTDLRGKVIGEFMCKAILPISITYSDPNSKIALREFPFTCLTDKEIMDYLGNGKTGYGFTISDLIIYDKPRELRKFWQCGGAFKSKDNVDDIKIIDNKVYKPITTPPQSWMYCYMGEIGLI